MFCNNCGNQVDDRAAVCPNCGAATQSQFSNAYGGGHNPNMAPVPEGNGLGWGLLGCCIPIVGLILFLVWKDQKPNSAKWAGIGALVSVILGVISYIILFALGMLGAAVGY